VAQSFDPFGLVGRAVDAARLGLDVYSWTEQQIVGALRKGLNELEPEDGDDGIVSDADTSVSKSSSAKPGATEESLNSKMSDLLNRALDRIRRVAPHDATVVIFSDFDGADETTRHAIAALAAHNTVIAVLIHDPSQSELPATGRMTVTDGELQIALDVAHGSTRQNILDMSKTRLRSVFEWTRDFGVPVLPLSTAEEPVNQLHHLLGLLPQVINRGTGTSVQGALRG